MYASPISAIVSAIPAKIHTNPLTVLTKGDEGGFILKDFVGKVGSE